ncbi:GNAT family N-acetyltransferase [Kutzneria buriramensis]|uniref:Acetyltransferase (GNAT) family protein n=1 Tax=Kutzneria buriramensis TaxID=1045776 RepID=A0A3E0HLK4_9PSEU|nr:GNAT family N-acetyltransferase [Kutzneria buriramensis]REH47372.1 acetyltransferase (GNAT) family protein [Kutzneria buriramensis]
MTDPTSIVGGPPSGARGEYGDLIPIRPASTGKPVVCLRGHRLELGGMTATYNHRYRLHATLCETCRTLETCSPNARRRAEWAHLDITRQHPADTAPTGGLVLVALPPAVGAMTGHIELRLDAVTVGAATLTCCLSCRTGSLDDVHVVPERRRLGYGRTLVTAALARAPAYTWTAPVPASTTGRAFRTRIEVPRAGAVCPHRAHESPECN